MVTIDKNIPIPNRQYRGGRESLLPWPKMAEGDSFFIDNLSKEKSASIAARAYRTLGPKGMKPLRRPEGNGFRFWAVKA